ncbi:aminoglycoside 6'-N-acetyltransferase [Oceanobacillus chungangensis]|uniref:Aminoglycoside N(6')-acetyltransferase type 1 n=1 Tax=Oceanobacillus chungangensis TaxID=1229152 RepID=A0A3D8PJF8_9BACI|nr:aminoglycoside 6'-N-acetyltransferase [Oceanobacillus chungangensis]RDW16226.1 GNAT family N-acetyltransferase [Oceanobacillus chungangensis]
MEKIIEASTDHLHALTKLGISLWPENEFEALKDEFATLIDRDQHKILLTLIEEQTVAFIHLSIRNDYVEGSNSSPTGYVEGIYVSPEYRKQGISRRLFKEGRKWLLHKGCKQVGSDIEWSNQVSYEFHKSIGFKEANRLITFIQDL